MEMEMETGTGKKDLMDVAKSIREKLADCPLARSTEVEKAGASLTSKESYDNSLGKEMHMPTEKSSGIPSGGMPENISFGRSQSEIDSDKKNAAANFEWYSKNYESAVKFEAEGGRGTLKDTWKAGMDSAANKIKELSREKADDK